MNCFVFFKGGRVFNVGVLYIVCFFFKEFYEYILKLEFIIMLYILINRKFKVLKICYGDELVVCNNCRGVCWRVRYFLVINLMCYLGYFCLLLF